MLVSCLRFSPLVQIAPETEHSRPTGSVIVTSPSPSGSTVISKRSRRSSTRRPRVTRPPLTVNASSRRLRKLIPMSSLKATRKRNPPSPSCASGMSSKLAVSGGGPVSGPSTVVEIPCDSDRPSAVQIAPGSPHGRPASSDIVRSPSESGSISNSHTTSRSSRPAFRPPTERVPAPSGASPPTGLTDVTSPPSTSTPCSPTSSGLSSTGSLNATCTLIRFLPSCRSGGDTNRPCSALSADEGQQYKPVRGDHAPHPSSPKRPRTRMLNEPNSPSRMRTVPVSSGSLRSPPVFCMVKLTLLAPYLVVISASHSSALLKLPPLFGGFQ